MQRLINSLLPLATLSCATSAAPIPSPSWCFEERHQGRSTRVDDIGVEVVRASRMHEALGRLRDRTVVELTADDAAAYSTRLSRASGARYFLVRANVSTRPDAGWAEIVDAAAVPGTFELHWSAETGSILVFSFQTVEGPRQPHNIALVLATRLPIRHAYVGCYVMD